MNSNQQQHFSNGLPSTPLLMMMHNQESNTSNSTNNNNTTTSSTTITNNFFVSQEFVPPPFIQQLIRRNNEQNPPNPNEPVLVSPEGFIIPSYLPSFIKEMIMAGKAPPLFRKMMKKASKNMNQQQTSNTSSPSSSNSNNNNNNNTSDSYSTSTPSSSSSNNNNYINNNSNNIMNNIRISCNNSTIGSSMIEQNQNSNNIISENTSSESDDSVHTIACLNCRRCKKKCDKKKPFCSRCVTHGLECIYVEPKRKGRSSKKCDKSPEQQQVSTTSLPINNNNSSPTTDNVLEYDLEKQKKIANVNATLYDSTQVGKDKQLHFSTTKLISNVLKNDSSPYPVSNKGKHLDKRQVLDLYHNVMGNGLVIFERKKFEEFLNKKDEEEDENETITNKKVHLMFLALKALCEQRSGLSELAEQTMKKTRELLSKIFDDHSNFYVACCYAYMCMFEIAEGKTKTAKYYLPQVDFYIQQRQEENQPSDEDFRNLQKIRGLCSLGCNDMDIGSVVKIIYQNIENIVCTKVPDEWKQILSQDVSVHNYASVMAIVEILLTMLANHLKQINQVPNMKLFKSISSLVLHGIKLRILIHVNRDYALMQQLALKITMCSENELITFVNPQAIPQIAAAVMVNLSIVRQIEAGTLLNNQRVKLLPDNSSENMEDSMMIDYYSILAKDYRLLTVLGKRFKKITLLHGEMLKEMECILAKHSQFPVPVSTPPEQPSIEFSPPPFFSSPTTFPPAFPPNIFSNNSNLIDFGALLRQNNMSMDINVNQQDMGNCQLVLDVEEIQDIYFNNYQ